MRALGVREPGVREPGVRGPRGMSWERPDAAALSLPEAMALIRARCPWAAQHSHASLLPYLLEEAHELAAALEAGAPAADVEGELGDVYYQVLFHAALLDDPGSGPAPGSPVRAPNGEPASPRAIERIEARLKDKLVRRHPHVFAAQAPVPLAEVERRYEEVKAAERAERAADAAGSSGRGAGGPAHPGSSAGSGAARVRDSLSSIPVTMPALARASAIAGRLERLDLDARGLLRARERAGARPGEDAHVSDAAAQAGPEATAQAAPAVAAQRKATTPEGTTPEGTTPEGAADAEARALGDELLRLAVGARAAGIDAEAALRAATARLEERAAAAAATREPAPGHGGSGGDLH